MTDQTTEKLLSIRDCIDAIDNEILELLSKRAKCAEEVGEVKRAAGETDLWFYRPEREAQILRRVSEYNKGPLANERVTAIFREVISSCLALEQNIRVSFLGPEGSFTQEAANKHFGTAVQPVPVGSIGQVFREVENGKVDYGVVPIENSTEGVISYTLDRFMNSPLKISGETALRIHQNLMLPPDLAEQDWKKVTRVYSHQQSLAQCRQWLDLHLPQAERVPVASNTEAAKLAMQDAENNEEGFSAAIAGKKASEVYGLTIVQNEIEDSDKNTTRFLVIGKQDVPPSGNDQTTLMISTDNRSGALYHLLTPLVENDLDMTRIESRPSQNANWEYYFFMDVNGHQEDENLAKALKQLEKEAELVRVLGSYPKAVI